MDYQNFATALLYFMHVHGISEICAVLETGDQKTIVIHREIKGENSAYYDGLERALKEIVEKTVTKEFQNDWECRACKATGPAETLTIISEGLEFYKQCPICDSQKIDYL